MVRVLPTVIITLLLVLGAGPALAMPTGAPTPTSPPSDLEGGDGVEVQTGQQLSAVMAEADDDVRTDYEETTLDTRLQDASETEQARILADRVETLVERTNRLDAAFDAATEAYLAGELSDAEYVQRVAVLNARADNLAASIERVRDRSDDVPRLELRAAGYDEDALYRADRRLNRFRGSGFDALSDNVLGRSSGEIDISVDESGFEFSVEREDGSFAREVERTEDDGDESITIEMDEARSIATDALHDPQAGEWVLEQTTVDRDDGVYEFEFVLDSIEYDGAATVVLDGSSGTVYEVESSVEPSDDDIEDDLEPDGEDVDDDDDGDTDTDDDTDSSTDDSDDTTDDTTVDDDTFLVDQLDRTYSDGDGDDLDSAFQEQFPDAGEIQVQVQVDDGDIDVDIDVSDADSLDIDDETVESALDDALTDRYDPDDLDVNVDSDSTDLEVEIEITGGDASSGSEDGDSTDGDDTDSTDGDDTDSTDDSDSTDESDSTDGDDTDSTDDGNTASEVEDFLVDQLDRSYSDGDGDMLESNFADMFGDASIQIAVKVDEGDVDVDVAVAEADTGGADASTVESALQDRLDERYDDPDGVDVDVDIGSDNIDIEIAIDSSD